MDELEEAYDLLGASPLASPEELQRAYRAQVKSWHPDRYHHDEEQRQAAEATMSRINAAYRTILDARRRPPEEFLEDDDPEEDEEDPDEPGEEADLEEADADEPEFHTAPGDGRAALFWILLFMLLPLGVSYYHFVYKKTENAHPEPSAGRAASKPAPAPAPSPRVLPANRPLVANLVRWAADDFVVDVWHNGQKVPDAARRMVVESFGATSEEMKLEIKAGDWLVFNVVNNRMRWGGAQYFGVAGFLDQETPVFVSNSRDGRWTWQDDPDRLRDFIRRAEGSGQRVQRIEKPWAKGESYMKGYTGGNWTGEPIWGGGRNTWIKYRVPLP